MVHPVKRRKSKWPFFVLFAAVMVCVNSIAVADTVSDISDDIFHEASVTRYTWGNGLYLQLSAGRAAWTETDYSFQGGSHIVQSDWDTIHNSPSYGFEVGYRFPPFFWNTRFRASLSYDDFYDFELRFDSLKSDGTDVQEQFVAPADSKVVLVNLYIDSPDIGNEQYHANFYFGGGVGGTYNTVDEATKTSASGVRIVTPHSKGEFAAKLDLGVRMKVFAHTYINVGNKLFYLGEFESGTTVNDIASHTVVIRSATTADDTYVDEPYVGLTIFLGSSSDNARML